MTVVGRGVVAEEETTEAAVMGVEGRVQTRRRRRRKARVKKERQARSQILEEVPCFWM